MIKNIIIAFLVICVGTVTYIQWDKYHTEKVVQERAEQQNQKEIEAIQKDLKKGDPLKKALEEQQKK